ncbi:MAG: ParB/RepB/Spo0J family partition protein [Candidatus Levybacteria bacterium]|nr:ParB/RepB/Spo0J family partition protein [Candidatus Levybacteria bacterium]
MDNRQAGQMTELETSQLQSNPLQPRGVILQDSLTDLVESIREQGILEPIVVARTPAGYQIIAGERRWRAAKILGLQTVPVVIKETTPQGMLEMSIVENVQREDLNPIEKALAYKRLIDEFGLGTNEVAKRVGKSAPAVSNTIRLLSLPDAIKDALVAGVITEGHVRPLISLGDPKLMLELFKRILRDNLTVRQTEEISRKVKGEVQQREPMNKKDRLWVPEQDTMAQQILEKYQVDDVKIFQSSKLARMTIVIKGDVDVTTKKLKQIHEILQGSSVSEDSEPSNASEQLISQ